MKKRILSVVLAVVMMVCLVGCGSVIQADEDNAPNISRTWESLLK